MLLSAVPEDATTGLSSPVLAPLQGTGFKAKQFLEIFLDPTKGGQATE